MSGEIGDGRVFGVLGVGGFEFFWLILQVRTTRARIKKLTNLLTHGYNS